MMKPTDLDPYRDEAERLRMLPPSTRRDFLRAFRLAATDKRLSRRDRQAALARVTALESLLGLKV